MRKLVRLSSEQWQELFERQKMSGLSVSAFCAREGVGQASFYLWRSKLAGSSTRDAVVGVERVGSFVDLGSLGSVSGPWSIRLELGGGVVLHLSR